MSYRQYKIFKTQAAFNFQLFVPNQDTDKKPAIFLEAASATSKRAYDWSNKIIVALAAKDLGILLAGLRNMKSSGESVSIIHDPGAQTERKGIVVKTVRLTRANNSRDKNMNNLPTYFLTVSLRTSTGTTEIKAPISPDEMRILTTLFEYSIPVLLGWR